MARRILDVDGLGQVVPSIGPPHKGSKRGQLANHGVAADFAKAMSNVIVDC
ncbi:MAG: hypothetical protein WBM46_05725 [Polyangiales bacterium]